MGSGENSEQLLALQKILILDQVKEFWAGSKLIGECHRFISDWVAEFYYLNTIVL